MNVKEIRELVDLVARRGIASLEIQQGEFRLKIEGGRVSGPPALAEAHPLPVAAPILYAPPQPQLPHPAAAIGPVPAMVPQAPEPKADPNLHIITSPIVGTFYRSPNPDAEPFVKTGDSVEKGQTLCIVEAMKLMNEIEADVQGTVVEVFPQNGQPVEYGERLFAIRTR
ncbi:MAG: acetyl-CoA carboxylase biotin carboxyl carrier protein [Acidobacteria bacterium]|nr:acetyl-CoA carboxylase biotin carboxyl carrier protein [Acidobacteriota bacterium]MCK6682418.1 acetyl-CoA carboxylase biotin carboxyl carrier protein [Thermoanaerobaculia bacterium]